MSRIRAAAAVTVLGAFLLVGFGAATAHAGNGAGPADHSGAGVVSNAGSGNIVGNVHGTVVNTQQTATGSGAGNQHNGLAVTGNSGSVGVQQSNGGTADPGRGDDGNAGTTQSDRGVDARVHHPHVLH
ncbi:hypothetical protein [Kitasatospora sp. NPDC096204]|uniref:hypothetical protein n=1 Tax=Kitasatospora sp. NPDC096204 TaxID=3364094 RepID=UPI0038104574